MESPAAIICDLDDTLAPSFEPIAADMAERVALLLQKRPFAVMSAASIGRLQRDVLTHLPQSSHLEHLYFFPSNAAACYHFENGGLSKAYDRPLSPEDRERIVEAVQKLIATSPLLNEKPSGDQIVDYGGYIAFTALGTHADIETKRVWDLSGEKREHLIRELKVALPEFNIYIGGTTSIDIMRADTSKAYGVMWLAEHLGVPTQSMLFIGDALKEGRNDAAVIPTGITTRAVSEPAETARVLDELIRVLAS